MSKKPQPQAKQNPKVKPQIVDQQNEPFLKSLQKKVRNINKKLVEISELEVKENLKPEQVEKINRKGALIEERSRLEETASFFKQSFAENAAFYRNNQLKELQVLARAITLLHSGVKINDGDKVAALWRALEQSERSYNTVNEGIVTLSNALKDFANDRKLQKTLTTYIQEHGNDTVTLVTNEEKIVNDVLEEKVETKPEPVKEEKVETPAPVEAPVLHTDPVPVVVESAPISTPTEETPKPSVEVESQPTPLAEAPKAEETEKGDQKGRGQKRYRGDGNRKPRGGFKGENRERKEGEDNREKRQYRPKYEERKEQAQVPKEDSDSSDSEPEARTFRKEEIRQLEDEGFIVVGKPKPKTRDQKEQKEFHDRQHGKKYHHHHAAKNS